MTPHEKRKSLYTKRMIEDMQLRNYSKNTIDAYSYHVDKFCQFFQQPADKLGLEEIRKYQLFLVNEKKASWSSFNQAVCALRFLYEVSLQRPFLVQHIPFGKRPKTLPTVLSDQEASRLIECVTNPKHQAVLLICYAAGMRLAEATHLKVADVDGDRRLIRITCGKGSKERVVPASPRLLEKLREYWKRRKPRNYLFPGKTPDVPLSGATVQKACKLAVAFAQIKKQVTPHTLRHSYATSMLEAGVDLLTISKLLGHSSFVTTMIYLHVRRPHLERSPSPIDWLPVRQCPQWAEPASQTSPKNPAAAPTQTNSQDNQTPDTKPSDEPPPVQRRKRATNNNRRRRRRRRE